jgi:hypothetical protein
MRKTLAIAAVAMLPIAFAACGDDDDDDNGGTTPDGTDAPVDSGVVTTVPTT